MLASSSSTRPSSPRSKVPTRPALAGGATHAHALQPRFRTMGVYGLRVLTLMVALSLVAGSSAGDYTRTTANVTQDGTAEVLDRSQTTPAPRRGSRVDTSGVARGETSREAARDETSRDKMLAVLILMLRQERGAR